jgi:carbamoyltransferase
MRTGILGISAFYHDSAAAILIDGELIAAAQEERFTRIKHDPGFPAHAIKYVLEEAGLDYNELTAVTFYEKPFLKFERLLETYHAFAPKGLVSFVSAVPLWVKEKLFMRKLLQDQLKQFGTAKIPLLFTEHHLSHAASAFYPSPFKEAAILTVDGVGEWATSTISYGNSGDIRILKEMHFPHSLGLLYSSFTYYLGFRVNSGEYKLMGLAPYGNPNSDQTKIFKEKILTELVDIREDGSILLNMSYFDFATRLTMTNSRKWATLFGLPRRKPESAILQEHMDLALAIQDVTESIVIALAGTARKVTNSRNLVIAGGVALNCVANSKILNAGIFDNIWIQPAAGDAGGAVGAAFAAFHIWYKKERKVPSLYDSMNYSYLGPQFSDKSILQAIDKYEAQYEYYGNFDDLSLAVSQRISEGNVIGWFQDRMEFGPRALGNRSILGDPRNPEIQKVLNLKIKFREGFRPFAPSVLIEDMDHFYTTMVPSPYMLFIGSLKEELRNPEPESYVDFNLYDRLYHIRSGIPAVTHVDYSARIQTVSKEANPKFWQLITDFKKITGCGILVNTSFNVRGEPIVCTPEDAYTDFMRTDMDYLVLGNYLLDRKKQKQFSVKHPEKNVIFAD